jgi:hypothetical protein
MKFLIVWRCTSSFKGVSCQHNIGHPEVAGRRNTLHMGNKAGNVFSSCREVLLLPGFRHDVKKCTVKFCYIKIIRQVFKKKNP